MGIDEDLRTWADVADAKLFTGQVVDEATMVQAQDIIDLFSGTTFDARGNLSTRNLRCLNRAVAYQAGWMPNHPDIYAHLDVTAISQDGASITPAGDNARLLAPFAFRWLCRLSWHMRPLRVRRRLWFADDTATPRDSAVADDNRYWTPIP